MAAMATTWHALPRELEAQSSCPLVYGVLPNIGRHIWECITGGHGGGMCCASQ